MPKYLVHARHLLAFAWLVLAPGACGGAGATPFGEAAGGDGGSASQGQSANDGGTVTMGTAPGATDDAGSPIAVVDAGSAGDASKTTLQGDAGLALPGISVSGAGFVDSTGAEFIPRGFGIGEWHNIEAYMLDINENDDIGGIGETKLHLDLASLIGQSDTTMFFTTWESNVVTEADVEEWAAWGANTVRLPMNYHALTTADGTYLEAGFQTMDTFIAWCKANHIYVILDLHAAPGAQNVEESADSLDGGAGLWTEPATYRQWTIDLWETIAKRYADETAVMGYDLFDEPSSEETSSGADLSSAVGGIAALRQMYVDITSAIRTVDGSHVVFIEGTNFAADPGFDGLTPAWDPQMAWSFHKYWDDNDTASIQPYLDLRTSTNRPVWNGETGENSYVWNAAMIALLEANKIGWNMWTYKKANGSGAYSDPSQNSSGDKSPAEPTQPYGIDEPSGYSSVAGYLAGNGSAPSSSAASAAVLAFAANAATTKCACNGAFLTSVFKGAACP